MEYHLKSLEWSGLKGYIGEQIARSFVRRVLAPKLVEEEGWNDVWLSNNDYKQHSWTWNTKLFSYDHFRDDFIVHGVYANRKLLAKYADAVGVLLQNHCTPDGLLMKLRDVGKTKRLNKKACPSITNLRIEEPRKHRDIFELPIVDGDLEVVEIKCGREAKLAAKQKETYNNLIAKGFPLRMIKVKIVSFDLNQYLVEEKRFERFV